MRVYSIYLCASVCMGMCVSVSRLCLSFANVGFLDSLQYEETVCFCF